MAEPSPRHSLLLPFDTQHPEFARGFEAGRVWNKLVADPEGEVSETVHGSNAEMFLRMAEQLQREVQSTELDETWIEIEFGPVEDRINT